MVPKHSSQRVSPESGSETAPQTARSFILLGIYFPGNLINLHFSTACTPPQICVCPAAHPQLPKLDLISQGWSDHVTEMSGLCVEHTAAVQWQMCWVSASIIEEEGVRGVLGQCRIVVAETSVICNNPANCYLGTRWKMWHQGVGGFTRAWNQAWVKYLRVLLCLGSSITPKITFFSHEKRV